MQEHQEELGVVRPPQAIRWIPVVLGAFVVALLVVGFWPAARIPRADQGANHLAAGAQVETIELQPLTGTGPDVSFEQVLDKVCFINFWGPWCGPCGIEFPHLVELEQKFHDSPQFLFLSVACGRKNGEEPQMRDATAAFLKRERATFPAYQDTQGRTRSHIMRAAKLGTAENFVFPTTVILGRDGRIRGFWEGYAPGDEFAMLEVVQAALQEP